MHEILHRPQPNLLDQDAGKEALRESESPARRRKRRGATSMEYLVMLSFILLVVIIGIQSFGTSVAALFKVDVNATSQHQPAP
jgi:Flp pilus assembly pilin Flp